MQEITIFLRSSLFLLSTEHKDRKERETGFTFGLPVSTMSTEQEPPAPRVGLRLCGRTVATRWCTWSANKEERNRSQTPFHRLDLGKDHANKRPELDRSASMPSITKRRGGLYTPVVSFFLTTIPRILYSKVVPIHRNPARKVVTSRALSIALIAFSSSDSSSVCILYSPNNESILVKNPAQA